jgi:carboxyl-terminal processing protease
VSIEGKSVEGISLYDAVKLLKGPEGTVINFEIFRDNLTAPVKYSLKRENIKINSVKYALAPEGIGYVRISQFIETTAFDLENAVINLEKDYKNSLKGLILDLRNNPGGLLTAAVEVSEKFLNLKKIVSLKARDQEVRDYFSQEQNAFDTPLVLLVNKGSASASEIVSGALQDNKRALIVGEKTYGKGCVQSVIELPDSSAIALTTAWYYTPSGDCIHEKGITPDIILENIKTAPVAKDSPSLETDRINSKILPDNQDLQYNRAYDILRGYNIFSGFRPDVIKTTGPIKITKDTNESQPGDKQ